MGLMAGSLATMIANAAFILVNARAIMLWSKPGIELNKGGDTT